MASTVITYPGSSGGGSVKQLFSQTNTFAITNNVTEVNGVGTGVGDFKIPANNPIAGTRYRVTYYLVFSTGADPSNMVARLKTGATILAATSTVFTSANKTNILFTATIDIVIRTIGVSGTAIILGNYLKDGGTGVWSGAAPISINTTVDTPLSITIQPNNNSTGNTFTSYITTLEEIK